MRVTVVLFALLTLITTSAFAATFDIGFNDNSFQLGAEVPLRNDSYGSSTGNARFLFNGDEETKLASVGFDFTGQPGNVPGLSVGVGTKLYYGETDPDTDFINMGIGLRADYTIPQLQGLGTSAKLYYAPQVFSGYDSEGLLETQLNLTYAIIPKVKVFLGYQNIQLDLDGGEEWTIDEGIRIGFIGTF